MENSSSITLGALALPANLPKVFTRNAPEVKKCTTLYTDGTRGWMDGATKCVYVASAAPYIVGMSYDSNFLTLDIMVAAMSFGGTCKNISITFNEDDICHDAPAPDLYTRVIEEELCDKLRIEHGKVVNTINIEDFEHHIKANISFVLSNDMHTIVS